MRSSEQTEPPGQDSGGEQGAGRAWTPTGLDTTGEARAATLLSPAQSPNGPGTKAEGHSLSKANKYLRHCRSGNRALVKRLTT